MATEREQDDALAELGQRVEKLEDMFGRVVFCTNCNWPPANMSKDQAAAMTKRACPQCGETTLVDDGKMLDRDAALPSRMGEPDWQERKAAAERGK